RSESLGLWIDVVAEDVHRAGRILGADFYSVDELDTFACCSLPGLGKTIDCVVIGERDRSSSCLCGETYQLTRCITSIGARAVSMKINQVVLHRDRYYPFALRRVNFAPS